MLPQYQAKRKKKEVDPNAPPRPTLLGHEKEMKVWREKFSHQERTKHQQDVELAMLRRKISNLESRLDAMESLYNKLSRSSLASTSRTNR